MNQSQVKQDQQKLNVNQVKHQNESENKIQFKKIEKLQKRKSNKKICQAFRKDPFRNQEAIEF